MVDLQLLSFILHNFIQAHIISIAVFNCWDLTTQHTFTNMTKGNYMYLQLIDAEKGPRNFSHNFERRFFRHTRPALGIFLDMNCAKSDEILNMTSRQRLFNEHYHWLLYDQHSNISNFQRLFVNANLSIDTDLTYAMLNPAQSNYSEASYILYDVYNNGRHLGGKLNMTIDREIVCNISGCEVAQYLSKLHLRPKYGNRNSLTDITMRVSTVVTKRPLDLPDPEMKEFLMSLNNTHIDALPRYGFKLIMLLRDVLRCNMTFIYTDRWSTTEAHGGTVGAVVTETAEIASTPFLATAARLKYVSALAETGGFRSICIFRTPRNSGIRGGVFLEPFSTAVWIMFGVVLALSSVFLWCTFYVEHHRLHRYWHYVPSLLTTCLISFSAACVQDSFLIPRSTGGRMTFISLSLVSFLMYNYYTSIVVSTLLGSPVKSSITTLGQLADSSLTVEFEPLPFTFVYLNASQLPEVRRLVQRKIEAKQNLQNVWIPVEEGIKKVRDDPGFVFVFEASTGYALVEKYYKPHEICDLNEIMLRPEQSLYTHMHKNSTYKELIRQKELRMLETGINQKHRRYWVRMKLNCFANNYMIEVGMEYAAPLFIMLLSSYFLVIGLMLLEKIYKKYIDKRRYYKSKD